MTGATAQTDAPAECHSAVARTSPATRRQRSAQKRSANVLLPSTIFPPPEMPPDFVLSPVRSCCEFVAAFLFVDFACDLDVAGNCTRLDLGQALTRARRSATVTEMAARIPTIERKGQKWKVWIVDETDSTITVRVRPLRSKDCLEITLPFRSEFNAFDALAAEAIDRYLEPPPAKAAKAAHS
jgi:hypothetical protein